MPTSPTLVLVNTLVLSLFALAVGAWLHVGRRWSRGLPALKRRRRRRPPWDVGGALLAAVVLGVIWSETLFRAEQAEAPQMTFGLVTSQGIVYAGLAVFAVLLISARHRVSAADFGAPSSLGEFGGDVLLGVAACAAMLPLVYGVQLAILQLGLTTSHPTIEQLLGDSSFETVMASVLLAAVIAPAFEEFAFRVLLQGGLERLAERRAVWPVVASSAAFASAHLGQGWAPVPLFVFALGLGYVYRQTHRFTPVLVMHMAFNALSLVMVLAVAAAQETPAGPVVEILEGGAQ